MDALHKTLIILIAFALFVATSIETARAYPAIRSLADVRTSIDIVVKNIHDSETTDADDKSYQLARVISWEPRVAYLQSVEAFLEGDYAKYSENISTYEAMTDLSDLNIDSAPPKKSASTSLLKLYTNVVAADFAKVNIEKFAQALALGERKNLTPEDQKAAEAAYYYASGNHDGLRQLVDSYSGSESFNRAFSVYLLAKMEGDTGSIQNGIEILIKHAGNEADTNIEPNFLVGLANLFIADLSASLLRTPSTEKLEELKVALAFARKAEINLSVHDYGAFYGLAHLYRGNIMKAVYNMPSYKDKEIERIFEVAEMFR